MRQITSNLTEKRQMKDKKFIDSNVLLYLLQNDLPKKRVALHILQDSPHISIQVLNENANVCLRKFKMSASQTQQHLDILQI